MLENSGCRRRELKKLATPKQSDLADAHAGCRISADYSSADEITRWTLALPDRMDELASPIG